jgi:hypothetical protein
MAFQKDNKLGKGGKRPGSGRKSKQVIANEAEAIKIFREKLAGHFEEFFRLAKKLCKGVRRRHYNAKTGEVWYEREYDTATLRFLIDRFIPAAKTTQDLNVNGPEKYLQAVEKAKRDEKALVKKD